MRYPTCIYSVLIVSLAVLTGGCGDKQQTSRPRASAPTRWYRRWKSRREQAKDKDERAALDNARADARKSRDTGAPDYGDALKLVRARRYREALRILNGMIERGRQTPQIWTLKGDCHHQLLEFDQAIISYKSALRFSNRYYSALRGLGFSQYNLARKKDKKHELEAAVTNYRDSLANLRTAAEILPTDAEVAYGRSLAAEALARFMGKRAMVLREKSDPQGAETNYEKAILLTEEALAAAKFYVNRQPRNPAPRILMGNLFMQRARLRYAFNAKTIAKEELGKSAITWQSILRDIDPEHKFAKQKLDECKELMKEWRAREAPIQPAGALPAP